MLGSCIDAHITLHIYIYCTCTLFFKCICLLVLCGLFKVNTNTVTLSVSHYFLEWPSEYSLMVTFTYEFVFLKGTVHHILYTCFSSLVSRLLSCSSSYYWPSAGSIFLIPLAAQYFFWMDNGHHEHRPAIGMKVAGGVQARMFFCAQPLPLTVQNSLCNGNVTLHSLLLLGAYSCACYYLWDLRCYRQFQIVTNNQEPSRQGF